MRSLFGWREASHRIRHEQSGADQSDPRRKRERRNQRGADGLPPALRKTTGRDAVQTTCQHEVRALNPTLAAGCQGTHRVTSPVITCSRGSERREHTHEHRARGNAAGDLRLYDQPTSSLDRPHDAPGITNHQPATAVIASPVLAKKHDGACRT
jgi:hypothetical protein